MVFTKRAAVSSLLSMAIVVHLAANVAADVFSVPYSSTGPTIDGVFGAGEWGSGYNVTFDRRDGGGQHDSTLYFQHDNSSLFVGVDSQWGSGWDVVWDAFIDGDNNGVLNGNLTQPYLDVVNTRPSPTGYLGYIAYRTLPSATTEVRVGFGTGAASASGGSSNVFYEFSFPFADLDVTAGDSTGFYISHGDDGEPEHLYELSSGGSRYTPENWDTLNIEYPAPSGDFDEDGDVDGDDFLLWQVGFSTPQGGHLFGDADFDGDVDGDDFLIWQSEFGSANGSASAGVPEPTSIVLLLTAFSGAVCLRRRYGGLYGGGTKTTIPSSPLRSSS